jgi:hypothetical protein
VTVCPVNSKGLSTSTGRNSAPGKAVGSPFFFNSCHQAQICCRVSSCHCETCVTVAPPTPTEKTISSFSSSPTLQPKNIAPHHQPRIRYAVNDVGMHVP